MATAVRKALHKPHYRMRSKMIHGSFVTKRWDYDHHVIRPSRPRPPSAELGGARRRRVRRVRLEAAALDYRVPIYIYDRLDEPTRGMLEENLALAEEGDICVTFATGMAAISAALSVCTRQGAEILAHEQLYGCTYSLMTNWLPRAGVRTRFVNLRRPEVLREAATPATRVVYFETPTNPSLEIIDIPAVRREVDALNRGRKDEDKIVIIVDNTFATPYCQRPLTLGAGLVAQLTRTSALQLRHRRAVIGRPSARCW
jgi:cystathionine beta-lyase/cystathionine gamma-synthase